MEVKDVSYFYKNKKGISNINLKIDSKIVGIIGKNGSGKTTLLEVLAGFRKSSGNIIMDGVDISNISHKDYEFKVSMNIEDNFLDATIKENFVLKLKLYHFTLNKIMDRIITSLAMVGLTSDILDRKLNELSSSEVKKVEIAYLLLLNPEVIILDNPSLYLDNKSKKELIRLLKLLKRRYGKTIIIASSDMEFIHLLVDYIYVLDSGKIVMEGSKYEVFSKVEKYGITPPYTMRISNMVLDKKNIKIGYRDDINDLLKDIYRNVG